MSRLLLRTVVLAAVCLLAALPAAAQRATMDADAKELQYYKLSTATLQKVIAVNRAMVQALLQDPAVREAMKIAAELEALEKKDELTAAEQKRMDELETRQQQLEDSLDNPLGGEARTLGEMEARIKGYAPMARALQKEGMAPREYAKFWLTFLQAAFAHGFQKSGMLKELPAGVDPDNVRFVEQHQAELEAMQKEFAALDRRK